MQHTQTTTPDAPGSPAADEPASQANTAAGKPVKWAARAGAAALSSTADYIRQNDLKSMLTDVQRMVKNNPGPALLTAAVLGFLVARAFSRD